MKLSRCLCCRLAGSMTLLMGYGHQVKDGRDEMLEVVERATANFVPATTTGTFLADVLPFRKPHPLP